LVFLFLFYLLSKFFFIHFTAATIFWQTCSLLKHVGFKLSEFDCYVATGGGFEINDPSSDLGVAISILSSLKNIPPLASTSFIGELGLSGQVRKSNNLRTKIEEAVRLGIKNIVVPKLEEELNNNFQNLINIKEISNIKEAVDYSLSV
jgi:DNA repair protein RadA/Sms